MERALSLGELEKRADIRKYVFTLPESKIYDVAASILEPFIRQYGLSTVLGVVSVKIPVKGVEMDYNRVGNCFFQYPSEDLSNVSGFRVKPHLVDKIWDSEGLEKVFKACPKRLN